MDHPRQPTLFASSGKDGSLEYALQTWPIEVFIITFLCCKCSMLSFSCSFCLAYRFHIENRNVGKMTTLAKLHADANACPQCSHS